MLVYAILFVMKTFIPLNANSRYLHRILLPTIIITFLGSNYIIFADVGLLLEWNISFYWLYALMVLCFAYPGFMPVRSIWNIRKFSRQFSKLNQKKPCFSPNSKPSPAKNGKCSTLSSNTKATNKSATSSLSPPAPSNPISIIFTRSWR